MSDDEGKPTESGEGEKKKLAKQRGTLRFGSEESESTVGGDSGSGSKDDQEKRDDGDKPDDRGKKDDKWKADEKECDEDDDDGTFDLKKYKKPTIVVYHDNDDLMLEKGVRYKPDDSVPKHGPGVTNEIETLYGPCTLLADFKYTTWADTVVPLRNHNVVQGFNEMALCLIKMAANGGENLSHDDALLAVSFLSNVRNDLGEYPPNILALMEHIDYLTRNDGTPGAGKPKFRSMDGCNLEDWY